MILRLVCVLLVCSCFVDVSGQVMGYKSKSYINDPGNPGGLNTLEEFPQGQGLDTSWMVIQSGSNSTPQWTSAQTIPFTFDFDGNSYTQYIVSTSGVLTFNLGASTVPDGNNTYLPHPDIPDQSICIWGMEGKGSNDIIVTKTFGTAPNRQHWVFFNSYNVPGGSANCWTYWSIVLEETTNKIYFVDQRHLNCDPGFTLGVQLDATTAYEVNSGGEIFQLSGNNSSDIDNQYYEMERDTLTVFNYDMGVVALDLDTLLTPGDEPFTLSGSMKNFGSNTVTDLMLHYSVNGGTPESESVMGLNMAYTEHADFMHSTTWTPLGLGTWTLRIWTDDINGNADNYHANDTLKTNRHFGVVGLSNPGKHTVLEVYPNPISHRGVVQLEVGHPVELQVRVLDMLGCVVQELGTTRAGRGLNQIFFDGSALDSGIYLLQIASGAQTHVARFAVAR